MSGMNVLNNGVRSLTGAVQKAYIQFSDERIKLDEINVTSYKARTSGMAPGFSTSKLKAAVSTVGGHLGNDHIKLDRALSGLLAGNMDVGSTRNIYEVKFNPSELSFQVHGGGPVQKANMAEGQTTKYECVEMSPRIMLNVPLIFDDYERTDAFMMEKFTDITAAARTLVSEGTRAFTGRKYNVRPQVEGFVAALRNERTRRITFYWGQMAYSGMLEMVDATYTMFNMEGYPIRAKVTLSILIVDEKVQDGDLGAFWNSYQAVFEQDSSRMGSAVQNLGNLVNLKL